VNAVSSLEAFDQAIVDHQRLRGRRFARERRGHADDWGVDVAFAAPAPRPAEDPLGSALADLLRQREQEAAAAPSVAAPPAFAPSAPLQPLHPARPRRQARGRSPLSPAQRLGSRPDRVAAWAVGLGLTLVFVAASTAHAAPL